MPTQLDLAPADNFAFNAGAGEVLLLACGALAVVNPVLPGLNFLITCLANQASKPVPGNRRPMGGP